MKVRTFALAGLFLPVIAAPAMAHHSFSMFDSDHKVTMTGTVEQLEWSNPHSWLYIAVPDSDGKVVRWSLEMQGTGQSTVTGWKSDSLKPGDKVTVEINPLRTGQRGGQLVTALLPDGKTLGARGRPSNPYGE